MCQVLVQKITQELPSVMEIWLPRPHFSSLLLQRESMNLWCNHHEDLGYRHTGGPLLQNKEETSNSHAKGNKFARIEGGKCYHYTNNFAKSLRPQRKAKSLYTSPLFFPFLLLLPCTQMFSGQVFCLSMYIIHLHFCYIFFIICSNSTENLLCSIKDLELTAEDIFSSGVSKRVG